MPISKQCFCLVQAHSRSIWLTIHCTWSSLASIPSPYAPYAFASAVLADGRVVVVGGEYTEVICPSGASPPCFAFDLTNLGAIYDPQSNTWTMLPPPQSPHFQCIGDAPSTVLADGRLIIGSKLYQDLAALDPRTLTWSLISATGKTDTMNSEEGWTLLPDGSFFTLDVAKAPSSERFLLSAIPRLDDGCVGELRKHAAGSAHPSHSTADNGAGLPNVRPSWRNRPHAAPS